MIKPSRFHFEIETPRPWRGEEGWVELTGWCLNEAAPDTPEVRLSTERGALEKPELHPRADVPRMFPHHPSAATCGFRLAGRLPAGLHLARFEARDEHGHWCTLSRLSLAVFPHSFTTVIDDPVAEGTLQGRVKVGGWACDENSPVVKLHLRYGHREVPCQIDLSRYEVAALYSGSAHARRSGFRTEDFLVAGHGPVRAKALLADGRTVVAPTKVAISIARDENHGPELDLTAPRVCLDHLYTRREPPVPPADPNPLNLLFILHSSFTANSALHVAAFANELTLIGHDCAVAVSHDLHTLRHLESPRFQALLHRDAAKYRFRDGRGPDIIHAWTCREHVRKTAESVLRDTTAKLVVQLEDNEQQVLAMSLGLGWTELYSLPEAELDRIVPAELTHPVHGRRFLEKSSGVTVIIDRLREFVPAGIPCITLWPAADGRRFFPRPFPAEFRHLLNRGPGDTVLFYHGNAHAANASEMRELYRAVLQLNREGLPVTLIRAGQDSVDFLGDLAPLVAPYVLSLGQILHHGHQPPLMALADIFVQPGRPDAFNDYRFPSKLPEFFSIGRPVILPRTNLGLAVRHGIDAFVLDEADATGIATAVRTLRENPQLAEQLGRGAARFAEDNFNWTRSAQSLAHFYHSLLPVS